MIGVGLDICRVSGQGGTVTLESVLSANPASYDVNFETNVSNTGGVVSTAVLAITTTRAAIAWADKADGTWQSFASGAPRITDLGILIEETRTNVVLRARDLSNASWTKTNCTAVKDQVGVDGVANSASSLTASADAATCTQAITLSSSARFQSAFLKRIAGTGLVEMSMDGGSTWTDVTPTTSAWVRKSMATQTLANPGVQIRMATNGDAIGVDFVQNENGTYVTSPIDATTVALNRPVDLIKAITPTWLNSSVGTVYSKVEFTQSLAGLTTPYMLSDGTTSNRFYNLITSTPKIRTGVSASGGAVAAIDLPASGFALGTTYRHANCYALDDFAAYYLGTAGTPDTSGAVPVGMNDVRFYSTAAPTGVYRIKRFIYWASRLSNLNMAAITK